MNTILRATLAVVMLGSAIAPAMAEPTYTAENLRMVSPRIRDQIVVQPHSEEHAVTFGMGGLEQEPSTLQSLPLSPRISSQIVSGFAYNATGNGSAGVAGFGVQPDCAGKSPRVSGPAFSNC